jgi:aryl-alcohol dehydrogenase-like predicted oxidoreductase
MQQFRMSVISGARSPEQVKTNAASGNWHLNAAELKAVDLVLAG